MRKISTIRDVVDWGLCVGCGACQYFCGNDSIYLKNIESTGIRPILKNRTSLDYSECLKFCPGYSINTRYNSKNQKNQLLHPNLLIGPTIDIWEGFATDQEMRYSASSGGALSAIALYCLEKKNMDFVLHVGMDPLMPWTNKTIQSRNRKDLLSRAGSRYVPSSVCEGLDLIEESEKPCVFIGKPCDVAAVSVLRKQRPKLDANLGIVLTFFCAGPPCVEGTLSLLKELDIAAEVVNEIRYRGNGWPGNFNVLFNNRAEHRSLTYKESWGNLVKHHRSLRCHLCPDGLGELADISCGDAWHKYNSKNNDLGRSLVLVRSDRGSELLREAMAEGYLELVRSEAADVIRAQPLVQRRAMTYGRLVAMKALFMPTPKFMGFPLREVWIANPLSMKLRTILGTLRRLLMRGLWRRKPSSNSNITA